MSEETLLSAARRALRFFRIDEAHGGLTSQDTLIAMDTLAIQGEKAAERERRTVADLALAQPDRAAGSSL
jgi:hypothetical protein